MTTYSHGQEGRPVDRWKVYLHAAVVALRRHGRVLLTGRGDVDHVLGGYRSQERRVRRDRRRRVAGGARHRDVRMRRRKLEAGDSIEIERFVISWHYLYVFEIGAKTP